jgi:hypothetical protein
MIKDPDATARSIAEFIEHKSLVEPFVNNFEWCKQKWPRMFTSASADGRLGCAENQMGPSDQLLFEQCHGAMMRKLGYWPKEA